MCVSLESVVTALVKRVRSDESWHNGEKQRKGADGKCQTTHIRCISHINLLLQGKNMHASTSTLVKTLAKKKVWFQKDEIIIYYRNSIHNNSLPCRFKPVWVSFFFHWMQTERLFDELVTLFYSKMKQKNYKHIIKLVNLTHYISSLLMTNDSFLSVERIVI